MPMNDFVDTKIDVWSKQGLSNALNSFFDGSMPDGAIDHLSKTEQIVFCNALKGDSRTYTEPFLDSLHSAQEILDKRLPKSIPRDKVTKAFVTAAAVAYVADIWDPLPIGETIASFFLSAATIRGIYLNRKNNDQPKHTPK